MSRSETAPARTMTAFRLSVDQNEEIKRKAKAYGMTKTDYIIAAALGALPEDLDEAANRFDALEARLERVERIVKLS